MADVGELSPTARRRALAEMADGERDVLIIDRETRHYLARVAAERESQDQPDDHTADAARIGAPDVRMGAVRDRVDSGDGEAGT